MKITRALIQSAPQWQAEAKRLSRHNTMPERPVIGSEADRCRQAAATSRLWGLPVGIVTTEEEVTA